MIIFSQGKKGIYPTPKMSQTTKAESMREWLFLHQKIADLMDEMTEKDELIYDLREETDKLTKSNHQLIEEKGALMYMWEESENKMKEMKEKKG